MVHTAYTRNDYVKMTLESGIPPLEMRYFPIVKCESGYPLAYRTETLIHSVLLGELPEENYLYVSDNREVGIALLKNTLRRAVKAVQKFNQAGRHVEFISVHCPAEVAETANLFDLVSEVLKEFPEFNPQQLCLEFPSSLLEKNTDKAHFAILDMKVLKVRTSIVGCGTEKFPIAKLLSVPPDFVILDPSATEWAGSRNKPQLLDALISYVKSMYVEVIAEGTPEQRDAMRFSDSFGFLTHGAAGLSFEDALAQKEGGDD